MKAEIKNTKRLSVIMTGSIYYSGLQISYSSPCMFQVVQRTMFKHSCLCVRVFGNVCTCVRPNIMTTPVSYTIICVVTHNWPEIRPPMTLHCLCRPISQMNDRPAQRPKEGKSSNAVDKAPQKNVFTGIWVNWSKIKMKPSMAGRLYDVSLSPRRWKIML